MDTPTTNNEIPSVPSQPTEPSPSQSPETKLYKSKSFIAAAILVGLFLIYVIYNVATMQKGSELAQQPSPTATTHHTAAKVFPTPSVEFVQGQIVVKFVDGLTIQQIDKTLLKYNARVLRNIDGLKTVVVSVPAGQEKAIQTELSKESLVKYAEPDYFSSINFTPNDPDFKNQYGLNNTGATVENSTCTANADVNAAEAWDVTKGSGVIVGIVDTGIDVLHPEFAGKIVIAQGFAADTPNDGEGHGTHVAGIIAANGNDGVGVTGICPECKLVIAKSLDDTGVGANSFIAEGIRWAADQNAKVINMSAGDSQRAQVIEDAVNYAISKGIVFVTSTGNNSNTALSYPAALPGVLSVSATDCNDQKSDFATYGTWVSVAAPGTDIYSTFPRDSASYGYLSGTSMASPFVAGLAGLVWTTSAGTSANAVVNQITSTADKIAGTGQYWQNGRINAQKAVGSSPVITGEPVISSPPEGAITPTLYCLGGCPTSGPADSQPTIAPQPVPNNRGGIIGLIQLLLQLILQLLGLDGGGNFSPPPDRDVQRPVRSIYPKITDAPNITTNPTVIIPTITINPTQ